MRAIRALLLVGAVGLGVGVGGPASAASGEQTSTITVSVPAPGNATTWTMPVANPHTGAVDVRLAVAGAGGADRLPLRFSLFDPVVSEFVVDDIAIHADMEAMPIAHLRFGESRDLVAQLYLSHAAGNEFQGVSQSMVFTHVFADASDSAGPGAGQPGAGPPSVTSPPWLAETGLAASLIFLLAVLTVLIGIAFLARRQRRKDEQEPNHEPAAFPITDHPRGFSE